VSTFAHRAARSILPLATVLLAAAPASALDVTVPIGLDTAFIRRALVAQVYTEPGEKAALWNDGKGCGRLDLFEPAVDVIGGRLRITSRGEARVGTAVGESCLMALDWKGFVEVFEEPGVDETARALTFRVVDSNVFDSKHAKRFTTGVLWDLVKAQVHPRLGTLRLDVGRAFDALRDWLPVVLPGGPERVDHLLASLALRDPRVTSTGVAVTLAFAVEPREPAPSPEPGLTPEEIARWQTATQQWDGFLTFVVKHFAHDAAADLRREAVDLLLDSRQDLLEALAPPGPGAPDPVPGLFVKAWERLAPLIHRAAPGLPAEEALEYLSFVTAGDALSALVRLGPDVGLDISADGLRRLARMIAPASTDDPIAYSTGIDPELRDLLGLGPPIPPPEIAPDVQLDLESWLGIGNAWAGDFDHDVIARLNRWLPERDDLSKYLGMVRDLLDHVQGEALPRANLRTDLHAQARPLVLATAWQESCWRQFVRKGGKLVPLRSPVGSVGIMQVNQHVWRGAYDLKGLQGDMAYNARAGTEILLRYLGDVAGDQKAKPEDLVRVTYAVYNGGPGAQARLRGKSVPAGLRRVVGAFAEKYEAVLGGRELAVEECYGET
jgi:hypothetical protein